MIDFDIESFVRKYVTKRQESLLAADFAKYDAELHAQIDGKRVLVVGGAGTIGSNYVKAVCRFHPAALYVVDIDENQMTELTRELRSEGQQAKSEVEVEERNGNARSSTSTQNFNYHIPAEYVTEPIDLGSDLFTRFFEAKGPFDIVANFAARKHVRAERDVFSIEAMCETNVFMAKKLLDLLVKMPPEHFFCVSTDKAANPVNVMGATKKLMEETIMAYAKKSKCEGQVEERNANVHSSTSPQNFDFSLPIVTARFANVAFSNGSLPLGWINRIMKKQPIVCPKGVRRFFVSPVESGELCLLASVLGKSGDIVYPKLDPDRDMISFDSFLPDFLREVGHPDWDVRYPNADTDGEKPYEEFFTNDDVKDENVFVNLGIVKNAKRRPIAEVEQIFADLHSAFRKPGVTKEDVIAVLGDYLPNFHHISNGQGLDARM